MDEILIEEKKYISSKRAAKMTGYAKDYIGQLCREGRVPARLVGRSWYVLETAIQDHRFGDNQAKQDIQTSTQASEAKASTKESPYYEASSVNILPSVNRLRNTEHLTSENLQEEGPKESHPLQDSWRAWFDHVKTAEQDTIVTSENSDNDKEEKKENENKVEAEREDSSVDVPIHVVYEPLPKDLLPISTKDFSDVQDVGQTNQVSLPRKITGARLLMRTTGNIVGMLLAIVLVVLAAIGTGYFDTYFISTKQANIISGITVYNK